MKTASKILIFSAPVFVLGILVFCSVKPAGRVCFKSGCFSVELAKTNAKREQGLMYRKSLDEGKGMLFIFDKEGVYPFWMKNTLIPLDMIWLDKDKKIVFISKNTQPCPAEKNNCPVTDPKITAQYVLEINAGAVDKIGVKAGDKADIWYN